jgi:alanine racemase
VKPFPVARINLAALRHNLNRVKQLAPQSRVMSVIKADAYGHGVLSVAEGLKHSDAFAVARLKEGITLREHGVVKPIVLLEGVNSEADFVLASQYQLSPVIHLQSQIDLLKQIVLPQPLRFNWLMVDSGMHRLGIRPELALAAIEQLQQSDNIDGEIGLMSHFANSDLVGDSRNHGQLDAMIALKKHTGAVLCLANSAAVLSFPDSHQDWVRPGLMLYGISPIDEKTAANFDLQPVMKLTSQLIAVYEVHAGEEVGYGGDWVAEQHTRVGVVSIGYGDGYSRHLSNNAEVLVNNQRAPVIGRVSMDTICLNLNAVEHARVGDEVILWGDQNLPVEQPAQWADTIPYELVTVICPRVQRVVTDG